MAALLANMVDAELEHARLARAFQFKFGMLIPRYRRFVVLRVRASVSKSFADVSEIGLKNLVRADELPRLRAWI